MPLLLFIITVLIWSRGHSVTIHVIIKSGFLCMIISRFLCMIISRFLYMIILIRFDHIFSLFILSVGAALYSHPVVIHHELSTRVYKAPRLSYFQFSSHFRIKYPKYILVRLIKQAPHHWCQKKITNPCQKTDFEKREV